ncbi:methyl-accepting chemotaxis protein [Nodosilinea sp. E11]|uniref:methyl-accepting chemotaxis protein n=1 Tax=Nodosilinea sp. E11 TaxID=3037479 RepID=UPI00293450F4|nr:methyl-accepting chemotaxis protein [Nodosilinea sp. E11]WOD39645.1 methyl-accepting chemotaxis protein [Nodosilinea sp. E11]
MSTTIPPRSQAAEQTPQTPARNLSGESPQERRPQGRSRTGRGLQGQAMLLAIAVGIVPVVTIGGLTAWMTRQAGLRNAEQQQLVQTQLLADRLGELLAERSRDAQLVASLAMFAERDRRLATSSAEKKQVLNQVVAESEAISMAFLDPQGQPLVQSDASNPLPELGNRPFFQQAIQSRQTTVATLDAAANNQGHVELVAPVIDRTSNQPIGAIWMQIPLTAIAPLFDRHLATGSQWHLFTGEGAFVAGSQPNYLASTVAQTFDGLAEQHASRQPTAALFPAAGGQALVSYAPVETIDGLGDPNLGALLTTEQAIALAPIRQQVLLLLLGTAAVAGAGAIALVWFAKRTAAPIVAATQAIENLRQGDFAPPPLGQSQGELAVLSTAIDQLAQHLQSSFATLEQTRAELEQQFGQHATVQDDRTQALQHELDQLLSAFSAVRMGDLTITAAVNPTEMGQLAAAFNQLIERLGQMLAAALATATEVTQSAGDVKTLAVTMASQTDQHVQSVSRVQSLVEAIQTLCQNQQQQVTATLDAIAQGQTAMAQGQQDIEAMTSDVGSLQRETQQMVGRTQTLTSYVDLATQFVKDQKRIAALTRVLALNASMLSTRASEQQDPTQFAAVTREFETIASQVNDLAAETNQSLVVLQRRTEQIQTVVSGLNHDVEGLSQQADSLTAGISQTNQTFEHIRTAMAQVTDLGQQVTQVSQAIAGGAETTLESIQPMAQVAAATSTQAHAIRLQSQSLAAIAHNLDRNVTYFQLPAQVHISLPPSTPEAAAAADGAADAIEVYP